MYENRANRGRRGEQVVQVKHELLFESENFKMECKVSHEI